MEFRRAKIPLLEEGMAQSVMIQFLLIIKNHRGLTRHLEEHGINGRWLNPNAPYDIPFSKLTKILKIASEYRETDEDFCEEWNHMCYLFLEIVKQ